MATALRVQLFDGQNTKRVPEPDVDPLEMQQDAAKIQSIMTTQMQILERNEQRLAALEEEHERLSGVVKSLSKNVRQESRYLENLWCYNWVLFALFLIVTVTMVALKLRGII